jgi:hypothetical protein
MLDTKPMWKYISNATNINIIKNYPPTINYLRLDSWMLYAHIVVGWKLFIISFGATCVSGIVGMLGIIFCTTKFHENMPF